MAGATLASAGWRRGITFGVPLAAILWGLIELLHLKGDDNVDRYSWWALILAAVGALIVFALLEVVGSRGPAERRKYGWIAIVIGADGRLSTSKTQALLWTIVLAITIMFLAGIVAFGPFTADDVFDEVDWEQYLVLLGAPFAAAVLAKMAVVTKLQAGTIQGSLTRAASPTALGTRVPPPDDTTKPDITSAEESEAPQARDALSNDAGEIDLADTQYLIFNFVALIYFLVVFLGNIFDGGTSVDRFVLPEIPAVLLGLTGASAATYVGNKAAQRDAPRIVSMSPQPVTPDGEVDVLGVNLVPPGVSSAAAATATSVMITKLVERADLEADPAANTAVVGVVPEPGPTATSVKFRMPPTFAGTKVNVRVVTSAAVATEPYCVEVK